MTHSESVAKKIADKFRYGLVTKMLLDRLARIRIKVWLYHLVREKFQSELDSVFGTRFDEHRVTIFGPDEMVFLSRIPGRERPVPYYLRRLGEDNICLGLKYRGEIAAFSWANLNVCRYGHHHFVLKANEAYLFDAYTMPAFRGHKLGPYVRHQLLKRLHARGRDTCYSITEFFNRPAIKFKQRLNAQFDSLWLAISVRKRYLGPWRLWGPP